MLDVRDLRVRFHGQERDAVKGISFQMQEGEILGLVGESGSGKTVTAMAITGLMNRSQATCEGHICFQGLDLLHCTREELRNFQGKEIAVVFQEPMTSMDPVQPIGPQVEESLQLHTNMTPQERRQAAMEALASVELPDPQRVYHQYPHQLSGGMLQRVMIAAAIISRPKLLICDEPTTALDVTIQEQILTLLKKINREQQTSILFISHNLGVVRKLCGRVAVMCRGELVEAGPVDQIFRQPQQEYTRRLIAAIPTRRKRG